MPASERLSQTERVGVAALDVWAFALPAASFVQITFVGQLSVSEILAVLMLPWLWGARDRLRVPRWFVLFWGAWFLAQIVTDIVVGSAFVDYARGWANILFTLTNFIAILTLVSTPRRARIFAVGLAASSVLGYLIAPNAYAAGDPWKWAFAAPIGFVLAAGLSGATGARRPWLAVGVFAVFGAANLLFGFRSLGGVAFLSAGFLLLSALVGRGSRAWRPSIVRAVVGLIFFTVAALGILQLYDAAATGGILGPRAQAEYLQQSGALGVLVGGRSEVLVSTQAILDSPLLGHGSWAKDFKYVDLLAQRLSDLGYQTGAGPGDVGVIPAHSYLLGSWVQAGLMGGAFWLVVLVLALWLLTNLPAVRLGLSPLLVFSTTLLIWNILFSPYAGDHRWLGPYGVAICLLGLRSLRHGGANAANPGVSVAEP